MNAMVHISDLARLSPEHAARVLARLSDAEKEQLLFDWRFHARDEQLPPAGDWLAWTYLGGRGAGKTRSGAEWIRDQVKGGAGRLAMIAPTSADARDTLVEGISGIKSVCWRHDRTVAGTFVGLPNYEPSKRRLTWANGAMATLFSAEEPERLRGPQHEALLGDELAAWADPQATWDMAMFGLRLGKRPRAMVTTTPKPIKLIRDLTTGKNIIGDSPLYVVTRGSTWRNRAHLAAPFFDQVVARYQGTRLGRQELEGELLEDVEGALWARAWIEAGRVSYPPDLRRIVVAIDPAITANVSSDLTGITVSGLGVNDHGYVLEDVSGRYSPRQWAEVAVRAYDEWEADCIVAEGNQGGELVRHTISTVRPNLPVRIVYASRGKQARAEPIASLYEQGRVHHVGAFPELEDQMSTWEPLTGDGSPDRLDSVVWGLTDLFPRMVHKPKSFALPKPVVEPVNSLSWMSR